MISIEIWASGSGSNAERIVDYFRTHPDISVTGIMTTNPRAGVLERAARLGVEARIISNEALKDGSYLDDLKRRKIDYIILAGFLKLVPQEIVHAYEDRMINVHPSLLPKYGGKNMYGHHVHEAVLAAGEESTGITIHLVNDEFDKGRILAQFSVALKPTDGMEEVQHKIHRLEHAFFPLIIEDYILNQ